MKDFNWDNLRFFLAMVRAGNPNAAARLLRVDHNTVRRRVTALESDLGARLFDRVDDRYALTDEGEAMLSVAESMEGHAVHAQSKIGGRDIAIGGTVRIGVPDGLGTLFIAPRLARLRQIHPQLNIELVVTSRNFDLSRREADMAIMIGEHESKRITSTPLTEVTMRLYASSSYLARYEKIENIEDLAHHEFVSGIDDFDFGPAIDRFLRGVDLGFNTTISCSSIVAQLKATAAGGGLCCFAKFIAATEPELIPVLPDQIRFSRDITLAVHADMAQLARIKAIAEFLRREFKQQHLLFG
jgi:DNA-binding transcriptional LysR family regulator